VIHYALKSLTAGSVSLSDWLGRSSRIYSVSYNCGKVFNVEFGTQRLRKFELHAFSSFSTIANVVFVFGSQSTNTFDYFKVGVL
jgi:hypothetical protein